MKSDRRAKAKLLKPLEIPSRKWAHVTMDLVTDLPKSNGFMAIVVFIDNLLKWCTSLDVKRRSQPWNMPRSSLTMSSNYTVSLKLSFLTGIPDLLGSFGMLYSTSSVLIFGSVLRFIRRQIVAALLNGVALPGTLGRERSGDTNP